MRSRFNYSILLIDYIKKILISMDKVNLRIVGKLVSIYIGSCTGAGVMMGLIGAAGAIAIQYKLIKKNNQLTPLQKSMQLIHTVVLAPVEHVLKGVIISLSCPFILPLYYHFNRCEKNKTIQE